MVVSGGCLYGMLRPRDIFDHEEEVLLIDVVVVKVVSVEYL